MNTKAILFLTLLLTGGFLPRLEAKPGDLDLTFDGDGVVTTDLEHNSNDLGKTVLLQNSSKTSQYESVPESSGVAEIGEKAAAVDLPQKFGLLASELQEYYELIDAGDLEETQESENLKSFSLDVIRQNDPIQELPPKDRATQGPQFINEFVKKNEAVFRGIVFLPDTQLPPALEAVYAVMGEVAVGAGAFTPRDNPQGQGLIAQSLPLQREYKALVIIVDYWIEPHPTFAGQNKIKITDIQPLVNKGDRRGQKIISGKFV